VKYSRGFKFFLGTALILTLGVKILLQPAASDENQARSAQSRLIEFLTRQHFSVSVAERAVEGQASIVATMGVCRILVVRSPPMGWDRDLVRRLALPADEIFVLYGGKTYHEQPTWLTVLDSLRARMLRGVGINSQPTPVYAIISPKSCNSSALPWQELAATGAIPAG
jgi:hypothetical protein